MFSFKANLEMKRHQFSFELISIVKWKPILVNDPRATMYSSFVFATQVHGVIGYKLCWLLPEDQNQGTPVGHESADTSTGHWFKLDFPAGSFNQKHL